MRRKKDNKRVLRAGNGRQNNSSKRRIRRNNNHNRFNSRPMVPQTPHYRQNRKKRKSSKTVMIVVIIALISFVIGAGIGVSLSFEDQSADEGPHFENVTKEMTSNLNETEDVYYDKSTDAVDFNTNDTSQLNVQGQYTNN